MGSATDELSATEVVSARLDDVFEPVGAHSTSALTPRSRTSSTFALRAARWQGSFAHSRIAFGELADPYGEARQGRIQNLRFAVGKRVAECLLVTAADLDAAHTGTR